MFTIWSEVSSICSIGDWVRNKHGGQIFDNVKRLTDSMESFMI